MSESISYRIGYKYKLEEEYTVLTSARPPEDIIEPLFELDTTGLLTIREGYVWDGTTCRGF